MKAYRYITGPDDAEFCRRITQLLNQGWELAGQPTLTYNADKKRVICGQTVLKEISGLEYSEDIDLNSI